MKTFITFFILIFSTGALSRAEIFAPFREGKSNYVNAKEAQSSVRFFQSHLEDVIADTERTLTTSITFEQILISIDVIVDNYSSSRRQRRQAHVHLLNLVRSQNVIDDVLYRLLLDSVELKHPTRSEIERGQVNPGPAIAFNDYLIKKQTILKMYSSSSKDKTPVLSSQDENPFPKKVFSFTVGQHRSLSAVERLFYLYSPSQMKQMAQIIDLALNVSDAESVVTTVTFRNPEQAPLFLAHSPTDQYRLAIRLMKMKKKEAENDRLQIGVKTANIDLITSAYLFGILNYQELALVIHDPNFYIPEVSMEKKVLKFVGGLALLGLKIHPVTAPYVIIPLILYNSYAENKKLAKTVDEDSFIFTLPGKKQ